VSGDSPKPEAAERFSGIIFEKPRLLFWKNGEFFCKVQVHCPFG
jgi:hypothetical protein